MNQRYILFQRAGVYYCEDRETRKQVSLRTRDRTEALTLLHAKNESARQPVLNLKMARVYFSASDPQVATRTWQNVMDEIIRTKTGANQERWIASAKSKRFDALRSRVLVETQPEHVLHVLQEGTVSTNVYLRRMHNFALDMNWLPVSIIPKRQWPAVRYKDKRAITLDEHQRIIAREHNPTTRAFYQLLWHLGGSQSDIATLIAEDIDWEQRTVSYQRRKTGVTTLISFGNEAATILQQLPKSGVLFPALARIHERHRAKLFIKRLASVGITGVSLHSYRYAWAERAKEAGYRIGMAGCRRVASDFAVPASMEQGDEPCQGNRQAWRRLRDTSQRAFPLGYVTPGSRVGHSRRKQAESVFSGRTRSFRVGALQAVSTKASLKNAHQLRSRYARRACPRYLGGAGSEFSTRP